MLILILCISFFLQILVIVITTPLYLSSFLLFLSLEPKGSFKSHYPLQKCTQLC